MSTVLLWKSVQNATAIHPIVDSSVRNKVEDWQIDIAGP